MMPEDIVLMILYVVFLAFGFLLGFSKVTPADPNDPYFPENFVRTSKESPNGP